MGDVFKSSYGPSRGPNIPLFVRFRDRWSLIDQSSWSSAMEKNSLHALLTGELSKHRERALHELKSGLESGTHPREDYEETPLALVPSWEETSGKIQVPGPRCLPPSQVDGQGNLRSEGSSSEVKFKTDRSRAAGHGGHFPLRGPLVRHKVE
ncbi:hypothetical protein GWK47_051322 [Chionoecetes opilio]|uniref:Uncharacterized protein n=1 Tax=Chionoecetes opilio TaxID=41210 RepID=A0A8J4Y258_CHIOP|nr:hypothetical protein GWK47_051322 [Chionoecetes opilio]